MASALEVIEKAKDPIRPFGENDVLPYYGALAPYLVKYLHGKELAAKIWLGGGHVPAVLKRGSKDPPLFIEDLAEAVTPELVELRRNEGELKKVKAQLTDKQALAWSYFVPRHLADFFYATNKEGEGKRIDRVFLDIDRGEGMRAEDALQIVKLLLEEVSSDEEMAKFMKGEPYVAWTGASFHVLFDLKKPRPAEFYSERLEVSGARDMDTNLSRWIKAVKGRTEIPVVGGHVKVKKAISIDPSQTPSGKLCRVPLGSLHMKDAQTVNGVSVPLKPDMLEKSLVRELQAYTPAKILEELPELAKRLPLR